MNEQRVLSGLRILVVEDQFLIAMELADQLEEAGCDIVGPASSVKQALKEMQQATLDGAVLDINLAGEWSFPIAEILAARGVPFLFLSGYDSRTIVPDQFAEAPRLPKPVDCETLKKAVAAFRSC